MRRLSAVLLASLVWWALVPGIALGHEDDDLDRGGNHEGNDGRGHNDDDESTLDFKARLSPGEEFPTPPASDGEGRATFRVEGSSVSFKLRWEDLTSGAVAGHIHCAATGANGAVGVDLIPSAMDADGRVKGSFTAPNLVNGCGWLDLGDVLSAMLTGNAYVNIHTVNFPGGEIRGQVAPVKLKFDAELSPGEEFPTPPASEGEGRATFRVEGSSVSFKLRWEDLTSGAVAGHIHCAATGANGAVGVDLIPSAMDADGRVKGSFTAPNLVNGCGWLDLGDVLSAMLTGNAYVNIHTVNFPGGEIRGQIERD